MRDDPPPEWFETAAGAKVVVAVSIALVLAVVSACSIDPTSMNLAALGAALVALWLAVSQLRYVQRRNRRPGP